VILEARRAIVTAIRGYGQSFNLKKRLLSTGALERRGDGRLFLGTGGLQRREPARVGGPRIRARGQERPDCIEMPMEHSQHQGGSAVGISGINVKMFFEQFSQT
jgi:hypothetical protein